MYIFSFAIIWFPLATFHVPVVYGAKNILYASGTKISFSQMNVDLCAIATSPVSFS
jgi:hypothetical protein